MNATTTTPRSARRDQRFLTAAAALSAIALVVAVIGVGTDHRLITGAPAWMKPAKFAVSISVYCATVAWLLGFVHDHPRLRRMIAVVTGTALLGELALIDLQVLRGTSSHFNTATPFDAAVFGLMGGLVALLFMVAIVLAVLLTREPEIPKVLKTGVVAGLVVSLIGMAVGALMAAHGAHTVGALDAHAGPSMWVTGWNLDHGDLRVAHFVGLHALQILPALAWALHRATGHRTAAGASWPSRVVLAVAIYYAGLVGLLTWQAERGRPLPEPGAVIGAIAIAWTLGAVVACAVVAWRAQAASTGVEGPRIHVSASNA